MINTFFTSDTHFGHERIIQLSNRPFSSVREMDEKMISNWNSKISKKDTVYFLGDFCFCDAEQGQRILDSLNGHKHLIRGNHEKIGSRLKGWVSISDYKEIKVENQSIVLSHYAMRTWNKLHYKSWMLYGHSHGTLPDDNGLLSIDVGVDCHNYSPISMSDLGLIMSKKQYVSPF
jgi:calcineurin-like phosphoesterase family protein